MKYIYYICKLTTRKTFFFSSSYLIFFQMNFFLKQFFSYSLLVNYIVCQIFQSINENVHVSIINMFFVVDNRNNIILVIEIHVLWIKIIDIFKRFNNKSIVYFFCCLDFVIEFVVVFILSILNYNLSYDNNYYNCDDCLND